MVHIYALTVKAIGIAHSLIWITPRVPAYPIPRGANMYSEQEPEGGVRLRGVFASQLIHSIAQYDTRHAPND